MTEPEPGMPPAIPEHAVSTGHRIRVPDTPVLVTVSEIRVTREYDIRSGMTRVTVFIEAEG